MSLHKRFRDTDTGDIYGFNIECQSDGTRKIYCTEHPDNPHGGSVRDHHLYSSDEVCVTSGREPTTDERAIAIAQVFMKSYSHYVRTGESGRTGGRVDV